jgi:hypothetical protein
MLKNFKKINFSKNYGRFTTISKTQSIPSPSEGNLVNFKFFLPNLQLKEISFDKTKTFKNMEQEIKKTYNASSIEFRTWDNSTISKNNDIASCLHEGDPVFMRIGTMEWQLMNTSHNMEYTQTEKYKLKEDFSHNTKNELDEIIKQVRNFNKNNALTDEEIIQIAMNLFKIKKFYVTRNLHESLGQYKKLTDLFETYYNLKNEYANLSNIKDKLLYSCRNKAKLLLIVGGLLFIIEMILIYWGVFIKYSWDIVEPITYLVGCVNFILILIYRKKFGISSAQEFYTKKFFYRLIKKKKFDEVLFNQTGRKIKEIEKILNK